MQEGIREEFKVDKKTFNSDLPDFDNLNVQDMQNQMHDAQQRIMEVEYKIRKEDENPFSQHYVRKKYQWITLLYFL